MDEFNNLQQARAQWHWRGKNRPSFAEMKTELFSLLLSCDSREVHIWPNGDRYDGEWKDD